MYSQDNSSQAEVARAGAPPAVIPLPVRRAASQAGSPPATARAPGRQAIDALQQRGIDDLAKFRLVAFLCEHPTLWAPAEHVASALGFHSVARTQAILEELVECGIVRRVSSPPSGHRLYGLAVSPAERATLAALCQQPADAPNLRAFLSRLADRSLARLRRERSRATRRGQLSRDEVRCRPEGFLPGRS